MGMFDTVHFKCPSCGVAQQVQSKAGPCTLENYTLDAAPAEVTSDLSEYRCRCRSCNCEIQFSLKPVVIYKLFAVPAEKDDDL